MIMRRALFAAAVLGSFISPASVFASDRSLPVASWAAKLDSSALKEMIDRHVTDKAVPGTAVIITQGDRVIFQHEVGVSDVETRTPMSSHSPMRLASATKVISGLVFLAAAERGLLDLDASIETLLPDAPQAWAGIPVWRFLNHSSGVPMIVITPDFNEMTNAERAMLSSRQIYEMVRTWPVDFKPGEKTRYQQSGYAVLATVLTEKTGKSWDQLVHEFVFEPAGMTETGYGDSLTEHPISYGIDTGALVPQEYYYPPSLAMGAGYNTTASDMAKLFAALAEGRIVSQTFYRDNVFSPQYIMSRGRSDAVGEGYSLATIVERFGDSRTVGHSGGSALADIRYAPDEEVGIAVLTNLNTDGIATGLTAEISSMIFGEAAVASH